MSVVNLFEVPLEPDDEDEPPGYGATYARVGPSWAESSSACPSTSSSPA